MAFQIENGFLKRYTGNDKKVTIPNNVVRISSFAFSKCNIEVLTIPNSVKVIDDFAFNQCVIGTVYMSKRFSSSSIKIYGYVHRISFNDCYIDKEIYFEDIQKQEQQKHPQVVPPSQLQYGLTKELKDFEIKNDILIKYNGKDKEVIIPEKIKSIGSCAFMGLLELQSVIIPESVKSIEERAFFGCENLKEVHMCEETSIRDRAFKYCHENLQIFKETHTRNFIIENNVIKKYIGNIKNVVIPSKVTAIDSCAFMGNLYIESVIIHKNVSSIGERAFFGCENLIKVDMYETKEGINVFKYCNPNLDINCKD